ncbi:MAG: hypothetical protein LBS19_14885 [Clostridiales bacterium]|nr:hypothetical protein [Clostridiales bacterium]
MSAGFQNYSDTIKSETQITSDWTDIIDIAARSVKLTTLILSWKVKPAALHVTCLCPSNPIR